MFLNTHIHIGMQRGRKRRSLERETEGNVTSSQGRVILSDVHKVLMGGGGLSLEWLHPPPKGVTLERK